MRLPTALAFGLLLATSLAWAGGVESAAVDGDGIRLEFDSRMRSRVVATFASEEALGPFEESETLLTAAGSLGNFVLEGREERTVNDSLGDGRRVTLTGHAGRVAKRVEVTAYAARPRWLFMSVRYVNDGEAPLAVTGWISHRYVLNPLRDGKEPAFWSYQSGSYDKRPDWVLPLPVGFTQRNFLGMNDTDYGGGTPVLDVWRRDLGLAVGHVELLPKLVSLPVRRRPEGSAEVGVDMRRPILLQPGDSLDTLRTFVAVHRGDHFEVLRAYSQVMQAQGLTLPHAPKDAFDPIWCAWGYGRDFTPRPGVRDATGRATAGLPLGGPRRRLAGGAGRLGSHLDKFPAGDADMKALVDRIHAAGMKAQLWWAPLAADPGSRTDREHPDWLLRNADGSTRKITWWDANYLCPAFGPVREDAAAFAKKALGLWGFDGLKIDGQHLNGAPPCYNPAHSSRDAGGCPRRRPGILQGDLGRRPDGQAGRPHRDLPVRHGLLLLHHALPQHGGGFRSREFLASAAQGQDAQGTPGRPRRLLRRSRGDERRGEPTLPPPSGSAA